MSGAAVNGINPLRARESIRRLLQCDRVPLHRLIQCFVVKDQSAVTGEERVPTVPVGELETRAQSLFNLGVGGLKLFAPEAVRDDLATRAIDPMNVSIAAIKAAKRGAPDLAVIAETCLCSYTTSGSCVVVSSDGTLDRATTMDRMRAQAVLQAQAGADVVGPASMMEGVVDHLRTELDGAGFHDVAIMPHVEFSSSLYKAYRKVANTGDGLHRRGFQVSTGHGGQFLEAAREMATSGANMLLVEPGLFFLDTLRAAKDELRLPVGIFSVSGESILFRNVDDDPALQLALLNEYFLSAFRAGADYIVSYDAERFAEAECERSL